MRQLVLTDWNKIPFHNHDVSRLGDRIAQEAIGKVVVFPTALLRFTLYSGVATNMGERHQHAEEDGELGTFGKQTLKVEGGLFWLETYREPIEHHLMNVGSYSIRTLEISRESLHVCQQEETIKPRLKLKPTLQHAHIVAQVESARGANARHHTLLVHRTRASFLGFMTHSPAEATGELADRGAHFIRGRLVDKIDQCAAYDHSLGHVRDERGVFRARDPEAHSSR